MNNDQEHQLALLILKVSNASYFCGRAAQQEGEEEDAEYADLLKKSDEVYL